MTTVAPDKPSPPTSYAQAAALPKADLDMMMREIQTEQQLREEIFPQANKVSDHALHALHAFHSGEMAEATTLLSNCAVDVGVMLKQINAAQSRSWYLRAAPAVATSLENFACSTLLAGFFENGSLCTRGSLPQLLDSEYLLGVMALCQELSRYAVGRELDKCSTVLPHPGQMQYNFGKCSTT